MEDFIEDLKKYAEPTHFPLDLPTEDDLIEVEEQLFLPLPREYRKFLLQASDIIIGKMEPSTAADAQSHTYLPEVAAEAWSLGLPRDVFPVCNDSGLYYCMKPAGTIVAWKNGRYLKDQEWEDIWEWANDVWMNNSRK